MLVLWVLVAYSAMIYRVFEWRNSLPIVHPFFYRTLGHSRNFIYFFIILVTCLFSQSQWKPVRNNILNTYDLFWFGFLAYVTYFMPNPLYTYIKYLWFVNTFCEHICEHILWTHLWTHFVDNILKQARAHFAHSKWVSSISIKTQMKLLLYNSNNLTSVIYFHTQFVDNFISKWVRTNLIRH